MTRYELTISPDYVPDWGIWEGIRELIQNATDSEADGHPKSIWYDKEESTMYIANAGASLKRSNLLLGDTTKANSQMIGKWGEGFKLAFICLLRSGIGVKVRTSTETWTPSIINSKRFRSKLLVVDIKQVECKWATGHLIFEVSGITPYQFDKIKLNYLGLQSVGDTIVGTRGSVLLNPYYAKKVYVAGLFVCTMEHEKMQYGYDFAPNAIELDRDRRSVSWFNLFWETSGVFGSSNDERLSQIVYDLIEQNAPEIEYYKSHINNKSKVYMDVCDLSYKKFLETHGKKAVPVSSAEDADIIRKKFNGLLPVILSKEKIKYIYTSPSFVASSKGRVANKIGDINTPYSIVERFLKKHNQKLSRVAVSLIKREILEVSKNWTSRG